MIVVLDTNTVLQAMARQNPLRPLITAWLTGRLVWAVSTEILLEYEELITRRSGRARWVEFAAMLDVMRELHASRLPMISPAFRLHLITAMPTTTNSPTARLWPRRTSSSPRIITSMRCAAAVTSRSQCRRRNSSGCT